MFGTCFAPPGAAEVRLEPRASAHHWGRQLRRPGHPVTLRHPRDVSRYRDGHKTIRADAKAILEAAANQALSRVQAKSVEQQDVAV